jgi:hypothetical protein
MQDRASYDFSAVPLNKVMRKGKSPGKESQHLREFAPKLRAVGGACANMIGTKRQNAKI